MPFIDNNANVSSLHLARLDGSELLVMRDASGRAFNRLSQPSTSGNRVQQLLWDDDLRHFTRQDVDSTYDARSRPWFQQARRDAGKKQVSWTQPYLFYTT